ncbi:MAG: alternative ribosome rescue aminoacyl-tRNA hydrolase ArfB [Cyanobacteria bacterium J06638_7]
MAPDAPAPQRPGEDLHLGEGLAIPAAELQWRFSRSGGPGGQSVNTSDSRVELVFPLERSRALPPTLRARALQRLAGRLQDGAVVVVACEHRSQWRNRVAARRRLLALLQEALRPPPPPRRPTRPGRGAVERRLAAKQRRSALKRRRGLPASADD